MTGPADPPPRTLRLRDGRRLCWAEYGDPSGRPVLAFHGAPACRLLFRPARADAHRLGLRLIAPDRPGYGGSDPHPGRRLPDWSADAAELLDHLAVARCPVLAISGGAPYAVAAAAHIAPRVSGLALVSPLGEVGAPGAHDLMNRAQRAFFLGLPLRWPNLLRRAAETARIGFLASPDVAFVTFRAALSAADRKALSTPEARDVVVDMTRGAIGSGLDGALSDMNIYARPWGVGPAAIRCPVRLWQGTDDRIVPASLAFDLAGRMPDCELVRIEGAGHFWILEHVAEVLHWIAAHT